MKKCPFRKIITITEYRHTSNNVLPEQSVEDFQECIGEECMAHYIYSAKPYWDAQYEKDYYGCKLMKRE